MTLNDKIKAARYSNDGVKDLVVQHEDVLAAVKLNAFGFPLSAKAVMPLITDIQVKNKRAIIVYFADGDHTKAVLSKNDTFNLEQGISICLMKKILADATECDGNNIYNKVVNYGLKMYSRKQKEAAKAKEDAEKAKAEANAKIARQKAKKDAKREEQINTQAEAFRRAMQKN